MHEKLSRVVKSSPFINKKTLEYSAGLRFFLKYLQAIETDISLVLKTLQAIEYILSLINIDSWTIEYILSLRDYWLWAVRFNISLVEEASKDIKNKTSLIRYIIRLK